MRKYRKFGESPNFSLQVVPVSKRRFFGRFCRFSRNRIDFNDKSVLSCKDNTLKVKFDVDFKNGLKFFPNGRFTRFSAFSHYIGSNASRCHGRLRRPSCRLRRPSLVAAILDLLRVLCFLLAQLQNGTPFVPFKQNLKFGQTSLLMNQS